MKAHVILAAVAALGMAAPAFAATDATRNCFRAHDWQDWKAPDDKTILVRVNQLDVWRIGLSGGERMITDDTNHLITNFHGGDWICHPIDLSHMKVSDGHVTLPLFVNSLTKLTPEQVALIPTKDRP